VAVGLGDHTCAPTCAAGHALSIAVEPVNDPDHVAASMRGVAGRMDGEVEGVVVLGVKRELTEVRAWVREFPRHDRGAKGSHDGLVASGTGPSPPTGEEVATEQKPE
jgi:hypothetical protein